MNKVGLIGTPILLGALFVGILLAHVHSSALPSVQDRPIQLFEQAHSLSAQLNAPDRPFALVTLLMNSNGIVSSDQYRQWCLETFEQSPQIHDGWDRVANEKNALVYLSYVAPLEALHKYSSIEDPQPEPDGSFPEDVPSDGARILFANVWNLQPSDAARLQVLPELKAEATRLSQRGEYPYMGMASVIPGLARIGNDEAKQQATEIYKEAVASYQQGSHKFLNRDREFWRFLEATKSAIPDTNLVAQAVQIFVDKVLQTPKDKEMDYEADIYTPEGSVHFNDDRDSLLFRAFPLILDFVPKTAADLKHARPELDLDKAVKPMEYVPGGYVRSSNDARALKEIHDKIRQYGIAKKITRIQESDLDTALTLAAGLRDDTIHIQGYSALLPALVESNPEKAQQLYYGECTRLQGLKNADDHLMAVVTLAKGSKHIGDDTGFLQLTKLAFKEGPLLFEGDSRLRPEWPVSGRRGYGDLDALVQFATSQNASLIDAQITQIDNISLKANLLSIEAKALFCASNAATANLCSKSGNSK